MICPNCKTPAKVVTGEVIYPHRKDLAYKIFWACMPCKMWVGCHHNDPNTPLGDLADEETRHWRGRAHSAFDPLWKNKDSWDRTAAYKWLAEQLGIALFECHIAQFNVEQCKKVVKVCPSDFD